VYMARSWYSLLGGGRSRLDPGRDRGAVGLVLAQNAPNFVGSIASDELGSGSPWAEAGHEVNEGRMIFEVVRVHFFFLPRALSELNLKLRHRSALLAGGRIIALALPWIKVRSHPRAEGQLGIGSRCSVDGACSSQTETPPDSEPELQFL
jgi:hypothetical protein